MSIIENEVEILKTELNKIEIKKQESLNIYSFDEMKELVYTENGRLKLNRFLKDRNIKLVIYYRRKERTLEQSIYIDNSIYSVRARKFDLRDDSILERYEMKNLAEYI